MPIPITTAPWIWFRPATGLIMRPASMTATTRLTRSPAISGCHVTHWERTRGERGIAECNLALVERNAGSLGGELREDRMHASADVLRSTCDAGCAVVAQL